MEQDELDDLRSRVPCAALLEQAGYAIDLKESTRRTVKYRRGDEIIIVIHEGRGWFDPLSDAKGDVFSLMIHLHGIAFAEAKMLVADLVGYEPREPVWKRTPRVRQPDLGIAERWQMRRKPWPGSATWRYLCEERHLPEDVIRTAIRQDLLREGPRGSMWAAHADLDGNITGWEERGPEWRGFSSGGAKVLFALGSRGAVRLCVTEAAIDALSLAGLEDMRPDTLYLSTGGGWAPATEAAIVSYIVRRSVLLVAATDNNPQGERYADRLMAVAISADCSFERRRPEADDWNADVKARAIRSNPADKVQGDASPLRARQQPGQD